MSDALLTMSHVSAEIGGRRALYDVTLEVRRGGSIGIVGETGSGKSLTCRAMLGLLGRIGGRVTGGSATFDGTDLLSLSERQWRALRGRRIGFVPQASLGSLDPVMRIGRQMDETIGVVDPDADRRRRSLELLESVHLPRAADVMSLYPHELSGGMRQRVMIALALAGRPQILVADEATTALDVTVQRAILDLLVGLQTDLNMALVIVTHDLAVVEAACETIAVMYAGSIVEYGPAAEVHRAPAHPYTSALMAAHPSETRVGQKLKAIPGTPPGLGGTHDGCPFVPRCENAGNVCLGGSLALAPISPRRSAACRKIGSV